MLFPAALALHLLALVLLAAGGVGGLFLHVALRRAMSNAPKAAAIGQVGAAFGAVATGAALLMLVTGLLLMASRGWQDWGQPWLSAKLAIFTLLFLNGLLVAKPTAPRLGAGLAAAARQGEGADLAAVRGPLVRMGRFHVVQSLGLVGLILLGVFGPR